VHASISQTRLFINPDIWREFFKPVYKKEFDLVHKFGAYVFFHSDGYTMDIIPDLIEIGADSLNIQFPINPIEELGRRFGGKVCFDRGLDRQKILPFGTIEDVKKQAKQAVAYLGCYDGGYIGGGTIASDVPLSNAEAMYKTFTKYGRYPIRENRAHIPQT